MTFAIAPETVAAMANLGLPVTADNWVHGLAEHIKRDAQCDIEEILLCEHMGFGIDRAAEKCKDRLAEDQVNSGQDNTAGNTENDRVANGFMCVLLGIASQRNTDKGTAAVTNKNGEGKRNYGQRKYDCIGRIAIGAKIAGVGDENLIHDVVKCAD